MVKCPKFDDFVCLVNLFFVIDGIGDEIQNQDFLGQLLAEHSLLSRNIDDSRIAQLAVEIVLDQQLAQKYLNRNGQEAENVHRLKFLNEISADAVLLFCMTKPCYNPSESFIN